MDFNWISIAVSAFIPLVFGAIWYHERLFGGALANLMGKMEQKGHPALVYGLTLVVSFFIAFYLFLDTNFGGAECEHGTALFTTFKHGAFHGAFITILLIMPILMIHSLFESKGFKYIFIHVGYWLISLVLMGGIVSSWH